jgi:hypothetical protein
MKNIIEISDIKLLESVTGGACECHCVANPPFKNGKLAISIGVKNNIEECRQACIDSGYPSETGCWGNGPLRGSSPQPPLAEEGLEFLRQAWEAYPWIPPKPSK